MDLQKIKELIMPIIPIIVVLLGYLLSKKGSDTEIIFSLKYRSKKENEPK